ncbi:MAG: hypothetical protein L6428_04675 [Candidatus Aminicenantes bacterium]|nr:hypothetical protein [Candidatus Aminicenantes bacterium]
MPCRGNIVISLLFVLLLSVSGLALLTHSDLHVKIIAARKGKWQAAAALEQTLLLDLHQYREKLTTADMNAFSVPEIDFFNNTVFPDQSNGDCLSQNHFSLQVLRSEEDFFLIRILNRIEVQKKGSRLLAAGQAGVDLLKGNIPAGEFGLVVNKAIDEDPAAYLAARGVEYPGVQLPLIGKLAVDFAYGRLLAETLCLSDPVPDWRRIREKLNLEPSDAPIPPGIYLVQDEGEVVAVFVEGDLDQLEFGADGGWQTVSFRQDGRQSELSYQPGLESLVWSGPEAVGGLTFAEKIIVHGNVWGIEQEGAAAFLDASRIQLLASGRLVVRSGLEGENLALQKEKLPNLLLMTSGRDFFSGAEVNGDIVLEMSGENMVQAQLLAAGTLINGAGSVRISGGIYAGDIQNSGQLQVDAVAGQFAFSNYLSLTNFKLLKNFRVHFIQEGDNE